MSDLSPEARAVLASARHHETPSAEVRARGWAELQARIDEEASRARVLENDASVDTWAPTRSTWSKVLFYGQCAAISVGIALGGILVVVAARAGMGTLMSVRHDRAVQAERVMQDDSDGGRATAKGPAQRRPRPTTLRSDAPVVPAPAEEATVAEPPAQPPPARQPEGRPERAKSAGAASIEADVALLRAAKAAQDPERAWALLQEHERRYPRSSFAIERQVLEVEALCRLGEIERGRTRATTFLRTHPQSAFTGRVRKACP